MKANFASSLAHVLVHEGGKVDDPRDPGGRTAYGVTQRVYDDYRDSKHLARRDVWAISVPERAAIYRRLYWDAVRGDDLPSGVDYCTFDFAVNSGPHRAARFLQRAVGALEDGKIGPVTLGAVRNTPPKHIIALVCSERIKFLRTLSAFDRFGKGWTRRVAEVQARAESMA